MQQCGQLIGMLHSAVGGGQQNGVAGDAKRDDVVLAGNGGG